jgi:hypothetical protein
MAPIIAVSSAPRLLREMTCTSCGRSVLGLTMPCDVEFHFQNKFEKSVHLVGFIIRKFVTTHGHMNVKSLYNVFLKHFHSKQRPERDYHKRISVFV